MNSVGDTFEGTAALSTDGRYFTQAVDEWILTGFY